MIIGFSSSSSFVPVKTDWLNYHYFTFYRVTYRLLNCNYLPNFFIIMNSSIEKIFVYGGLSELIRLYLIRGIIFKNRMKIQKIPLNA